MAKIGIIVLADTETHGDVGRTVNALKTAKESKEAGDELRIVFDGAGTKWPVELDNPEHKVHPLYQAVKDKVAGACDFCSAAFGVKEQLQESGIRLLNEYEHHPSLRKLLTEGYNVLTF